MDVIIVVANVKIDVLIAGVNFVVESVKIAFIVAVVLVVEVANRVAEVVERQIRQLILILTPNRNVIM